MSEDRFRKSIIEPFNRDILPLLSRRERRKIGNIQIEIDSLIKNKYTFSVQQKNNLNKVSIGLGLINDFNVYPFLELICNTQEGSDTLINIYFNFSREFFNDIDVSEFTGSSLKIDSLIKNNLFNSSLKKFNFSLYFLFMHEVGHMVTSKRNRSSILNFSEKEIKADKWALNKFIKFYKKSSIEINKSDIPPYFFASIEIAYNYFLNKYSVRSTSNLNGNFSIERKIKAFTYLRNELQKDTMFYKAEMHASKLINNSIIEKKLNSSLFQILENYQKNKDIIDSQIKSRYKEINNKIIDNNYSIFELNPDVEKFPINIIENLNEPIVIDYFDPIANSLIKGSTILKKDTELGLMIYEILANSSLPLSFFMYQSPNVAKSKLFYYNLLSAISNQYLKLNYAKALYYYKNAERFNTKFPQIFFQNKFSTLNNLISPIKR